MRGILCRNQNGAQKDFRLEYIKMRSFCLAGKLKVNKATFANCVCVWAWARSVTLENKPK